MMLLGANAAWQADPTACSWLNSPGFTTAKNLNIFVPQLSL
jgi:hypothetical protein